jgi:hypothetical protein
MSNIIGRASFRFWPLGHVGDLAEPHPMLAVHPQGV